MGLEKILEEIIEQLKAEGCVTDNDAGNRAEEIIRSHMNDGWIPVEEQLPTEKEYIGGYDRDIPWLERLEIAYMTDTLDYKHGYYDGHKWFDERHRKIENVIAWKIHEPYRPEKGDGNGK